MIRALLRSLRSADARAGRVRAVGLLLAFAVLAMALVGAAHLCGEGHDAHGCHDSHDGPAIFAAHDVGGCGLCFAWTSSRGAGAALAAPVMHLGIERPDDPSFPVLTFLTSFERRVSASPRAPPAV